MAKSTKHLCDMQWFQKTNTLKYCRLINTGHKNTIPIIDNFEELDLLQGQIKNKFKIGIRIAAEEEPNLNFIPPDWNRL
jgi:hypothetical protein